MKLDEVEKFSISGSKTSSILLKSPEQLKEEEEGGIGEQPKT